MSRGLRRVLVLLATLVGVTVTASLGVWQLGRAAQKQALLEARERQGALGPLDGAQLFSAAEPAGGLATLVHRRITLKGRWLQAHTVFLDNRSLNGRAGFHVVTPLQLDNSQGVVLVQRGWAPRAYTDRSLLPPIQTPKDVVRVEGRLAPWPSRIYDFGEQESGTIRQNLDFALYRQQTGLPLMEISVQQTGAASEGLLREWPAIASGVEKHHGYAFQWFGLSALMALLYVWFQIVKPRRQASQHG